MPSISSSNETLQNDNTPEVTGLESYNPTRSNPALSAARAALIMAAQDGCLGSERRLGEKFGVTIVRSSSNPKLKEVGYIAEEMGIKMADNAMDAFVEKRRYDATFVITDEFHKKAHDAFKAAIGLVDGLSIVDDQIEWERIESGSGISIYRSQLPDQDGTTSTIVYRVSPETAE